VEAIKCRSCFDIRLGHVIACPSCSSDEIDVIDWPATGHVIGATHVHSGSLRPTPFHLVLIESETGHRVVGFAAEPLAVGTFVTTVHEEDGVPHFAQP
jgi:uncharacterized OB-fold protein